LAGSGELVFAAILAELGLAALARVPLQGKAEVALPAVLTLHE
jgi:hypothetical protein